MIAKLSICFIGYNIYYYHNRFGYKQFQSKGHLVNKTKMQTKKLAQISDSYQSPYTQPQRQRLFQKWLSKNHSAIQKTINIQQSLKRLKKLEQLPEKPEQYITDPKNQFYRAQANALRDEMSLQNKIISDMSKSNFKKVISRDQNNYKFGQAFRQQNLYHHSGFQQFQKRSTKKKDQNFKKMQQIRQQMKLQRHFIHNFFKTSAQLQNRQRPLTLEVVNVIDTKQFDLKHKDVQFYDVLTKTNDSQQKFSSNYNDISDNYQMDQLLGELKFDLIDRDQQFSNKSTLFLFKAEQQLDFWRRLAADNQQNESLDQVQVMKKCQNLNPKQPSYLYLLQFAAGKVTTPVLASYFKLKQRHELQLKMNETDQNLEEQYNRKKQQYDFLRQMKVKDKAQRVAIKYTKNTAQTIDNLQDQSFQSYFEQNGKDLLLQLEQLNKIRDNVLQKQQTQNTRKVMLMNIGYQIKEILFKLLSLTLKGEDFVNYQQIIKDESTEVAQRKMLEAIYHQFHKVQVLEVDGISKTKILDIYLQQRQKNEKMFELLGRIYVNDKNKKTTSKGKTNNTKTNKTPTKNVVSKTPPKYQPPKTARK